ncbi:tektin-2-like, partial [Polyodon spathula]|uniref:tektin-2-like n=1 Tax=Polyodon spathula TaxID=7913 RepID=UPI001B7E176B
EARGLRYETSNKSKWDEQDTCTRLSDRIDEVTKWKDSLLKCLDDVDTEIKALSIVKESTEKALAATSLPLDVAIECLTLREGRRGNDLVRDHVEAELHKEVEVIDRARKVLQQKVSQAIEQLCLLQEVWQQLTFDLRQKNEALDVDQSCLSLNVNSAGLSLKLSPSRVPPW